MGNLFSAVTSISEFDHRAHLRDFVGPNYAEQSEGPDSQYPDLGPIYTTTVGSQDGKPAPQLQHGFEWQPGELKHDVLSVFLKGRSLVSSPDAPFLSTRAFRPQEGTKSGYAERKDGMVDRFQYVNVGYEEAYQSALTFGRGLVNLGVKPSGAVSIFAANCPEWIIYLLGLFSQNMTCVPLYPSLGPGAIEHIIGLVETECLVVSLENIPTLIKTLEKAPHIVDILKHLIIIDSIFDGRFGNTNHVVKDELRKDFKEKYNIEVHGFSEILKRGEENKDIPQVPAEAEQNAFIMFTSGTVGVPKGVRLTHSNLSSCVGCVFNIVKLPPSVRMYLYLPLQHVFSVVLMCIALLVGGTIYFSQPDVRQIASDMQLCKPHILPTVPRVFLKFFQVIWSTVEQMPWYKRWYIMRAYNYQLNQARNGLPLDPGYDKTIFSQFREKLGLDSCNIIVTGGSPCPAHIFEFMKVLLYDGWAVSGYGATETTAGTCITTQGDPTVGSIGGSIAALKWRLADVPDLEYYHKENTGELLLHGTTIFAGYYKNEEETNKALIKDEQGRIWYRTGDVARYNPGNNSLSIIDRKKSLLKLSQGEYVSIERLLNTYAASPLVNQIFIYGNSFKSCLVSIASPNPIPLYQFAKDQGWWSLDEVPQAGNLSPAVITELRRIGREYQPQLVAWLKPSLTACESQLLGFEKIKALMVETRYNDSLGNSWNEANDLMTPTQKLKYAPLSKRYLKDLKRLYESVNEPTASSDVWY